MYSRGQLKQSRYQTAAGSAREVLACLETADALGMPIVLNAELRALFHRVIVAFRAFQIPVELQELHGYPALSDCAKRKILGLNAAAAYGVDPAAATRAISADTIEQWKLAYRHDPGSIRVPTEKYYGPRTRREFLRFLDWERHGHG